MFARSRIVSVSRMGGRPPWRAIRGRASVGGRPKGSAIGCRQQIVRRIARSNRRVSFDVIAPD